MKITKFFWFFQAYGMDWFLKHTKVELGLISDRRMWHMMEVCQFSIQRLLGTRYVFRYQSWLFFFLQAGLRGGISYSKLRYAKVTKPTDKIVMIDVNNQYGYR